MVDDMVKGGVKQGLGRIEDAVGGLTGDGQLQAKGKVKEAAGAVQQAFGQAKDSVKDAFEDTLEGVRGQVDEQLEAVESLVVTKPLPSIAIAATVGILIGLLLRGGSKTVYLRDAR